jgi:hypothetical protein
VVDAGGLVIHVRLDFAAGDKRSTEPELPSDWAGQSHLETGIRNLKTLSANTVLLDTPPLEYQDSPISDGFPLGCFLRSGEGLKRLIGIP